MTRKMAPGQARGDGVVDTQLVIPDLIRYPFCSVVKHQENGPRVKPGVTVGTGLVDRETIFIQFLDGHTECFQFLADDGLVTDHHDGHVIWLNQPARQRV